MLLLLLLAAPVQAEDEEPTDPTEPIESLAEEAMSTTTDGPALDAELLAWLETSKGAIQLPVDVQRSVLGITGATVLGADLALKLDDGRMGISLADQLRHTCGAEGPCRVWLEGEWGATLPMPGEEAEPTLSVRKVVEVVEGDPKTVRVPRRP